MRERVQITLLIPPPSGGGTVIMLLHWDPKLHLPLLPLIGLDEILYQLYYLEDDYI